jgi:sugar phosphate isomerase/epimerase
MDGRDAFEFAVSTLGCPEWDADTVVERVSAMGYDAIEWRGGDDGTVRTEWPADRVEALRRRTADAGVGAVAVTAYPDFVAGDPLVRRRSVDHVVGHAELAASLGAPWVRIFLGIADDAPPQATVMARAMDGIRASLDATRGLDVGLAIEPHDDLVRAADVAPVLGAIADPRLGVVWDIGNAWAVGEGPEAGAATYAGRIAWMQVKDGRGSGDDWRLCDLGDGDVPIGRALDLLRSDAAPDARGERRPIVSLEWERAWHPELAPAEVAFPSALQWLRAAAARAVSASR